ncbi:ABC transporter substrate-binding protein [Psychromonas ossibalaenae]|uniref:ABC transporter substrate-binding protein n=1 Tax=Psychromonas ossibalaenae TaxID=444922 RepID=UPI000367DABD|nr:ABC transporter substrate-binding protein [Psychromonas ossibalaenae]
MIKKFVISTTALLLLTIIGFMYWQSAPNTEQGVQTSGLPIKVARYYWPGMYWIEIAAKKGWFKEAGLNVDLIDCNSDYYASLQDMVDGKIDTNNFYLFDFMRFNAAGADLLLIINSDNSTGSEAIIAKPVITTIADLKGKKIGVDKGSNLEYILDTVLKRHGLMPADVIKVQVSSEQAAEEFGKGQLDAVVTWEPVVSAAVEQWHGRKLFNTSAIPGISPVGWVFKRSFTEQRPGDVQAFVNVWHRTTLFIKNKPKEAFAIIADIYNVTAEEVETFARLDQILDLRDNLTSFSYGAGFESLHGTARHMTNFLIDKGVTKKQLDSTKFIDAAFIRSLKHSLRQEAL